MSYLSRILGRPYSWVTGRKVASPGIPLVPEASAAPLPELSHHEGLIDELSLCHASGWMMDPAALDARSEYEILIEPTGEVLAQGRADQFKPGLSVANGTCGFWTRFNRPVTEAEREQIIIRPQKPGYAAGPGLNHAPALSTRFEPVYYVAMDIVDNCNLRCPFCVVDYSNTRATNLMTDETIDAAIQLMPFTRDGEFWFSCLHEPTLHPDLTRFIDKVPAEYRQKIFFTTNLSKRMPESYFTWLAQSGIHHINISIESLNPEIFERMRRGARHRIFLENWDRLIAAFAAASAPPLLRYIVLGYKSNLQELPSLVQHLRDARRAWLVEVRYTFDMPFIPEEFRRSEYLDAADWNDLRARLSTPDMPDYIQFVPAPEAAAPSESPPDPVEITEDEAVLAGRIMLRMSWDGSMRVFGIVSASTADAPRERKLLETNIRDIGDPETFLASLG